LVLPILAAPALFAICTPILCKWPSNPPIGIHNPYGNIMYSTHEAKLDLPALPLAARQGHIVPALSMLPLISIGQLCDAGCNVKSTTKKVTVWYNGKIALNRFRSTDTRLWHLDLSMPIKPATDEAANAAIACLCFPGYSC
jgi:hypothetical protein